MKSSFKFHSYKVDTLELSLANTLNALSTRSFDGKWNIEYGLRIPQFFKSAKVYVCGVDCTMIYPALEGEDPNKPTVQIRAGAIGLFEVEEGRIDSTIEEKMVRAHFPTLVLPYLRAAISSCLASAGVGIHIFPLINLHDMALETLKGESIVVIE